MTTPYYSVRTNEIPNMAGKALTVRGPVDPDSLGVTLMHEHLVDIPMPSRTRKPGNDTPATQAAFWDQPLTLENLHAARRDWPYIYDQYVLQDGKVAAQEVMEFKYHGGSTLVDLTCTGVGRDPAVLLRVSYATGLNIVMGTGWYTKKSYPEGMEQRGVHDLADEIIRDVTVGVGETGARSGIIGEIGITDPLEPDELKVVRAAARASRATGAAVSFHWGGRGDEKLQVADAIEEEGGDLTRTVYGHSDLIAGDTEQMLRLLERGVYIQFDLLGRTAAHLTWGPTNKDNLWEDYLWMSGSALVAEGVRNLIGAGYLNRILISQYVCTKVQLKRYGGTGYSYILEEFLPHLRKTGTTEDQIRQIMVENPKNVLTFVEPQ